MHPLIVTFIPNLGPVLSGDEQQQEGKSFQTPFICAFS